MSPELVQGIVRLGCTNHGRRNRENTHCLALLKYIWVIATPMWRRRCTRAIIAMSLRRFVLRIQRIDAVEKYDRPIKEGKDEKRSADMRNVWPVEVASRKFRQSRNDLDPRIFLPRLSMSIGASSSAAVAIAAVVARSDYRGDGVRQSV